jgi:2'-hydroxyisoflavone reductase
MIVPGSPADPIQIIDVRDLSDWIVHCIEENITGVFNATGPGQELPMKGFVEGIRTGLKSECRFEWVPYDFLKAQKVESQFPLYAPPAGETAGFHRCDIRKALKAGLKFRPLSETAKATMEWYQALTPDLQSRLAPQFATREGEPPWLEQEKRVLEAWSTQAKR